MRLESRFHLLMSIMRRSVIPETFLYLPRWYGWWMNSCNDSGVSIAYILKATELSIWILFKYRHQIFEWQNKMNSTILILSFLRQIEEFCPKTAYKSQFCVCITCCQELEFIMFVLRDTCAAVMLPFSLHRCHAHLDHKYLFTVFSARLSNSTLCICMFV
jgi:hypothetical protein